MAAPALRWWWWAAAAVLLLVAGLSRRVVANTEGTPLLYAICGSYIFFRVFVE